MLYMEIIAVCSEMHTKHINTLCINVHCVGRVTILNAKTGSIHSNRWALKGYNNGYRCVVYIT